VLKLLLALLMLPAAASAVPYSKQAKCLADNLHYEARGESLAGIRAVANVVLNRVASKRWPNSICKSCVPKKQSVGLTITERGTQSWWRTHRRCSGVVVKAMAGRLKDNTRQATHYHTPSCLPPVGKQVEND